MISILTAMIQILRKRAAFVLLFFSIALTGFAQKSADSVKILTGKKPFNKFSVGINAGVLKSSVIAGGSNDFTNNKLNLGYGLNVKYQLTHAIAFQADFIAGNLSGDQSKKQGTDTLNLSKPVVAFKTHINIAGSVSAVYTFSNINWLNLKNWIVPYIGIGAGLASWNVKWQERGTTGLTWYPYGKKKNITELYMPISTGVRVKLTKNLNLDLGYTMHFLDEDNLDGFVNWRVPTGYSSTNKKDKFSYTHLGIEYVFGKKSKKQLMYDNPVARLNNNLQAQINKLSDRIDTLAKKQKGLDDFDGDGVADLFDKEPNTPAGCPVDAQGVMRDTDGDGVVDCKDKQLITPTECQPVDADGVGKCPDPACCKGMPLNGGEDGGDGADGANANCPSDYPSLNFRGNTTTVASDNRAVLATIAAKMKARPDCKIVIKGYPETSKSSQAVCQRRLDAIKMILIEKEGISADRITTNIVVAGGDKNKVDISSN